MDKILIIDDNPLQAKVLESILEDEYEVTKCYRAEEGLEIAKSGDFSLILSDIVMPGMDGFALLRELQETVLTKYIPVILITSLSDYEYEEQGLIMGAVDYITRPFNELIVKARVKVHVKLYHYQREFREQATVDDLTGISNRRSYNKESLAKWREAISLGLPFSVCMLDVDNFKLYNDTYGHPAGDKALAAVAKAISSHLQRATDYFARYGGEEFAVILVGNDAHADFESLKMARRAVEELRIPHAKSTVSEWVTISIGGVTVIPKRGDTYEGCQKIADTMLYDAKLFGRNMVVWSNQYKEQWRER